jgi:hypothetical protein
MFKQKVLNFCENLHMVNHSNFWYVIADGENEPSDIRGKKKANRGAPVRVAWYFYIIPRLRSWFATRKEAQLLRWHDEGRKELNKRDGNFRHLAYAAQWGNINNHFPWFDDTRSI